MKQLNLFGDTKETEYETCPCCLGSGKEPWFGLRGSLQRTCHCCNGKGKIKKRKRLI